MNFTKNVRGSFSSTQKEKDFRDNDEEHHQDDILDDITRYEMKICSQVLGSF